jgi:hypothetical protein
MTNSSLTSFVQRCVETLKHFAPGNAVLTPASSAFSRHRREAAAFKVGSLIFGFAMCASLLFPAILTGAEANLLKNPGFEQTSVGTENSPNWTTASESASQVQITEKEAHGGQKAMAILGNTSVEQKVDSLPAGAYLARCWIKSEADQSLTFLVRNPDEPWAAYNCAEIRVPRGQWTQIQTFCALDREGPLTVSLGGVSKEFHLYHGTAQDMSSSILADDFELVRYEAKVNGVVAAWDAAQNAGKFDWAAKSAWSRVDDPTHVFNGAAVIQGGHLAGSVRKTDSALVVYSLSSGEPRQRCAIVPSVELPGAKRTMVQEKDRIGIKVSSDSQDRSYTAWFTPKGLIQVEATHIPQMQVRDCNLRYGLLPSFAGTDFRYSPADLANAKEFNIPSTQWFVGLADGNDSMMVAVWQTNSQSASLGAAGPVGNQVINTLSIGTGSGGLFLSFVDHTNIWHLEPLKEDWLGDYVSISWERPFPARWMSHLFVTTGGMSSFRDPGIGYSFPIANAKTRMWGVWFEDWNHYPFYFDGTKTVFHFEKTFVPQREALIYFLEPAAADLFSPVEIVEQALGHEKAMALFDLGANQLRKLKYSTPDQFMFDRPVCATTTRLSKIKQGEKPTVGVDLATHLYEFIREIRGRVDQYGAFFSQTKDYLDAKKREHPELKAYAEELEGMVAKAQSQSEEIYSTPLDSVETKIEKMRALLREGKGDGFNCGNLDVRDTAGSQDDLCRRYNRFVIKLAQTAALKCGDSSEKAVIATYIWDQSRGVLRRPTRWESRRTLYFFEP